MTPVEIRAALEAHAEACRVALREMRPRPDLPETLRDLRCARLDGASLVGASLDGASLDGARLVGARLDRASLDRASLVGASLVGASLVGASLDGASLDRASLVGASLVGASLVGASLVGASLDGASLVGASLDGVGDLVAAHGRIVTALVAGYSVLTCQTNRGRIMRFGCKLLTVADWRAQVSALCEQHEPRQVARYEAELLALLDYCDALDRMDAADAKRAEVAK